MSNSIKFAAALVATGVGFEIFGATGMSLHLLWLFIVVGGLVVIGGLIYDFHRSEVEHNVDQRLQLQSFKLIDVYANTQELKRANQETQTAIATVQATLAMIIEKTGIST